MQKNMWYEINTQSEAEKFMENFYDFHDSCIKEFKYISGAYVNDDLSMCPFSNKRILKVLVQRQFEPDSMIELEFSGLKKLTCEPYSEEYTCEILGSKLIFKDGLIWWWVDNSPNESCIVISASKLRYRSIQGRMGEEEFYIDR